MNVTYHDVLSRLGIQHAHPGGEWTTMMWMNAIDVPPGAKILDVGCGNGATACEMAERWHADVTGVDIRSNMVRNVKKLARSKNLTVRAVTASAERLPFENHAFDYIVCESVLVFTNIPKTVREFRRVLKPGGTVIDTEMLVLGPVSDEWRQGVHDVYGAREVPDLATWRRHFQDAGMRVQVLRSGPIQSLPPVDNQQSDTLADQSALQDPRVLAIVEKNARWMQTFGHLMGYGIFICTSNGSET